MNGEKFHSITVSRDTDAIVTTRVYHGSRAEMEALAAAHRIDEAGDPGWLKSIRLKPLDGRLWECEFKYEGAEDWDTISVPGRAWGKKVCQLRGATLSRPLESHPDYRTKWNHCLFAAAGTNSLPSWYAGAVNTLIPAADAKKYCWGRDPADAPYDGDGRWRQLAAPLKPGVESYDLAVYTVIETARFRYASQAGSMAAGSLNRIGTPSNTFGIGGGNWKCDDAEVSWNGKCWIARLSWTQSGDENDWDGDLYGTV